MALDIHTLPRVRFIGNWKLTSGVRRDFLIRDLGGSLTEVTQAVATALMRGGDESASLGVAAERRIDAQKEVTLRLIQSMQALHQSKVDISLVQRTPDLFVRVSLEAHSWLKYLQRACVMFSTWLLFILLAWYYLHFTGAFSAVTDDAVRQLTPSAVEAPIAKRLGFALDPMTQEWVAAEPVSLLTVLRDNPRLAVSHFATPFLAIVGLSAAAAYFLTKSAFDRICAVMGWPTPRAFDDFATANEAWAVGIVNKTLMEFGVSEVEKIAT